MPSLPDPEYGAADASLVASGGTEVDQHSVSDIAYLIFVIYLTMLLYLLVNLFSNTTLVAFLQPKDDERVGGGTEGVQTSENLSLSVVFDQFKVMIS